MIVRWGLDTLPDVLDGPAFFLATERWGNDNIPFPASAYRTYITELYQQNLLAKGQHRVRAWVVHEIGSDARAV